MRFFVLVYFLGYFLVYWQHCYVGDDFYEDIRLDLIAVQSINGHWHTSTYFSIVLIEIIFVLFSYRSV